MLKRFPNRNRIQDVLTVESRILFGAVETARGSQSTTQRDSGTEGPRVSRLGRLAPEGARGSVRERE